MSKRTAPLPGNDGTWFLELIREGRASAGRRHQHQLLARNEPAPTSATAQAVVTADAPAGPPAGPSGDEPLGPAETTATTESVRRMWTEEASKPLTAGIQTSPRGPLADWKPDELSKTMRTRRNYRWSVIAVVVAVGAAAAVAISWVPTLDDRAADERAEEYGAALGAIHELLPAARSVLDAVTDVAAEVPPGAAATVAGLTNAAEHAGDVAAADLPSSLPLMPRGPIEDLQPHREHVGLAASDAAAITRRLQAVVRYRTDTEGILALPPLPLAATASTVNELSVQLASLLADAAGVVAELPADGALGEHRSRLGEVVERLGEWQVDYLDALRREDSSQVTELVDEATLWDQQLDTALRAGMAAVRSELDRDIARLAGDIEEALAALPH